MSFPPSSPHREDLLLPKGQRDLINEILAATTADLILVVFSGGGAIDFSDYVQNDRVVGILSAGFAGMYGGQAAAEILVGKVNPSACAGGQRRRRPSGEHDVHERLRLDRLL